METTPKHPLHDLFREQRLVMDALVMASNLKPLQMEIINGVAYPVEQELTEYETNLHYHLNCIDDKIRRYENTNNYGNDKRQ